MSKPPKKKRALWQCRNVGKCNEKDECIHAEPHEKRDECSYGRCVVLEKDGCSCRRVTK